MVVDGDLRGCRLLSNHLIMIYLIFYVAAYNSVKSCDWYLAREDRQLFANNIVGIRAMRRLHVKTRLKQNKIPLKLEPERKTTRWIPDFGVAGVSWKTWKLGQLWRRITKRICVYRHRGSEQSQGKQVKWTGALGYRYYNTNTGSHHQ